MELEYVVGPAAAAGAARRRSSLVALAAGLLLAACASAPESPLQPVAMPAAFKEAAAFRPASLDAPVPDNWWVLFGDPVLDSLQSQLAAGNQNLQSAVAQYRAAQAALAASRSALYPGIGVASGATRSSLPPLQQPANLVSLSANASWEADLWGRLQAQVDAAQARLDASQADLASVRLSLQALLAQTYFSLRSAEAQIVLLDASIAAYTRSLQLTRDRYQAGVVSAADVAQAQAQLKSTEAARVDARTSRAQLEHALAVLAGQLPAAFSVGASGQLPALPPVPLQLPSQLLQRRPDIAGAASRVAAAQAQIGAARAAFFPDITLSATGGYRHSAFGGLISAPSQFWSLGPALAVAVFDGGARQAAVDSARATADQATASYRATVLAAFQEVEDNLVLATGLREQAGLLQEALGAARRALQITEDQYKAGTVSYLNVVTAQATMLAAERSLLDARTRSLAAANQLLKNIAGRWDTAPPAAAPTDPAGAAPAPQPLPVTPG